MRRSNRDGAGQASTNARRVRSPSSGAGSSSKTSVPEIRDIICAQKSAQQTTLGTTEGCLTARRHAISEGRVTLSLMHIARTAEFSQVAYSQDAFATCKRAALYIRIAHLLRQNTAHALNTPLTWTARRPDIRAQMPSFAFSCCWESLGSRPPSRSASLKARLTGAVHSRGEMCFLWHNTSVISELNAASMMETGGKRNILRLPKASSDQVRTQVFL